MPTSLSDIAKLRPAPLRAFLYDRNSRISRKGSNSTEDQAAVNRRWCERAGCSIGAEYSDPGRGATRHSKASRPDFDAMMKRLEAGIVPGRRHAECDIIVVWASSRATRRLDVYVDLRSVCERGDILLCYDSVVYDMRDGHDRYATGSDALQAEREGENIRDGITRTTRANAERGRPHGPVPFGYRREYDPQTGELVRQYVYEPEAAVVREIAARIAAGHSCRSIAADLNARGIRTPRGHVWGNGNVVKQMMVKPTYLGQRQHQGKIIGAAQWDPVFQSDDEVATYLACMKVLTDPTRKGTHDTSVKYLLSGIAFCGVCGPDKPAPLRTTPRPRDVAYTCPQCFGVAMQTGLYDDVVTAEVLAYMERPEFLPALAAAPDGGASAVSRALAEAAELERQLADARRAAATVVDGRLQLSVASLASLEASLVPQIEAARLRARDASVPPILYEVGGPGASARWKGLDLLQRREAVRAVVRPYLKRAPVRGAHGPNALLPQRFGWDWIR